MGSRAALGAAECLCACLTPGRSTQEMKRLEHTGQNIAEEIRRANVRQPTRPAAAYAWTNSCVYCICDRSRGWLTLQDVDTRKLNAIVGSDRKYETAPRPYRLITTATVSLV